ncbi:UMTA methyltransferase [Pseudomassariella vexata]|uniref:UMTA methyltransferase n=1 Tax=Pseudomassariella vexata TaxID=1141098 RepID=A0A1Y2DV03_9PEZI|nr:UMTA methyltransferase [Pseudomassariella vexata]ORY63120.1 UMTA methyltransferase [Pseudomassariella vexata]
MDDDETVEVAPDYHDTFYHHDRLYHVVSVNSNTNLEPVDEAEIARLENCHQIFYMMVGGHLALPNVDRAGRVRASSLRRVLDCGTGPANWAIDVANAYPWCEALGTDISANMLPPDWNWPDRFRFELCNLNETLQFGHDVFDLVNSRGVAGGINASRWPQYVRDIYRAVRPGGWCQMVETHFTAQSFNGTLPNDGGLSRWSTAYMDSMSRSGKEPRAGSQLAQWLTQAGFENVQSQAVRWPMCGWSDGSGREDDAIRYDIGLSSEENISSMLSALAFYPLTVLEGMDLAEFQLLAEQARQEASNPAFQPYFWMYVAIGQKPRPSRRRH